MKKVICVDAKGYTLTEKEKYVVDNEDKNLYRVKDDNGNYIWFPKECFRPVPEQEYQYGQEVIWSREQGTKIRIIATNKNYAWVDRFDEVPFTVKIIELCPVQSMRERVKEYIASRTSVTLSEVETDRIIELIKNEKG